MRFARPGVERLGDRILPATWLGTTSQDWGTAANWNTKEVPGLPGSLDNSVLITSLPKGSAGYPVISAGQSYTITKLSDDAGFKGGAFQIKGTLTIAGDNLSSLQNGGIQLLGNGLLDIQEPFTWSSSGNITGGTVQVDKGGALSITGGAATLSSTLNIGGPTDGSVGTVTLNNMNQNLSMGLGGGINIYTGGYLNFAQSSNSNGAGGISQGTVGSITVLGGKVERTGSDNTILNVGMPVVLADGGRFIVDAGDSILINNAAGNGNTSLLSLGGDTGSDTVELGAGATLNVSNGIDMNGANDLFKVDGSATANTTSNIGGNLNIEQGEMLVGVGEANNFFTTLNIAGNFAFQGGLLAMSVQGGMGSTGHDAIAATGSFTLNNDTTLQVDVSNNQAPTAGFKYVLITANSTVGVDFGSVQSTNDPPINWKHALSTTNYSIWA